jgi:hypothetical protein
MHHLMLAARAMRRENESVCDLPLMAPQVEFPVHPTG